MIEAKLAQRFEAALERRKAEVKPIYDCDDRRNFFDPTLTEHERVAAQATAVLVDHNQLERENVGQDNWSIKPRTGAPKLCSPEQAAEANSSRPERFWDEPLPGNCSGFKVGKRRIATAGHCIADKVQCGSTAFVFGFHMKREDDKPDRMISRDRIYHCKRIIDRRYTDDSDWIVVEVDRNIDAPLVTVRQKNTKPPLSIGTPLTVIGYPLGLPVKIAGGAEVREVRKGYLVANLDTYHGNSGSVVLNTDKLKQGNLLAEGILVRGDTDFEPGKVCELSRMCPAKGCRMEDVTLASEFVRALAK